MLQSIEKRMKLIGIVFLALAFFVNPLVWEQLKRHSFIYSMVFLIFGMCYYFRAFSLAKMAKAVFQYFEELHLLNLLRLRFSWLFQPQCFRQELRTLKKTRHQDRITELCSAVGADGINHETVAWRSLPVPSDRTMIAAAPLRLAALGPSKRGANDWK